MPAEGVSALPEELRDHALASLRRHAHHQVTPPAPWSGVHGERQDETDLDGIGPKAMPRIRAQHDDVLRRQFNRSLRVDADLPALGRRPARLS